MKSYTDLEQSKKLAEILPIESADMWWNWFSDPFDEVNGGEYTTEPLLHKPVCYPEKVIPCWSLAALLSVFSIPKLEGDEGEDGEVRWWTVSHYTDDYRYESDYRDEPIDACYNLILKLKEKDLL